MVAVTVKHDLLETIQFVDKKYRKQLPFALAVALTKTAQRLQMSVVQDMENQFDRPTPFVRKAMYVSPAKKQNLQAAVFLKDRPVGKNPNSIADILEQQFAGGRRIRKRLEQWLERAGLISANEFVAPGSGAKLDRYGNLSSGQIQQILSQVRAGPDQYAYASKSARSLKNQTAAGRMFWSRGGRLPRGVWMRDGFGVKPVLLVIASPNYRRRINMEKIAEQVIAKHFDSEFDQALEYALRTAR